MKNVLKGCGCAILVVLVVGVSCATGMAMAGLAGGSGSLPVAGRDAVAVVYVEGAIQSGDGGGVFSSEGAHSDRIIQYLRQAGDDRSVRAVVLRVDSPGGGVTASDEIHNAVVKLKETKPVVASFGSLAASGGYYISAPATKIVSNDTSLTGSIGVITVVPNVKELLEKLGVEMLVLTSGPHKDETSGLRPLTEEDRAILQGIVDESYRRFVTVVASGRGMPEEQVRRLADGRVYTGRQARAAGLVDQAGDLPEAIDLAAQLGGIKGTPRVVRYRGGGGLLSGGPSNLLGLLPLTGLTAPSGGQAPFSLQYRYLVP